MKKCTACRKRKKLEDFYRRKTSPDGRRSTCKECTNKPRRKLRAVKEGETPPAAIEPARPKTVSEAAENGTTRELLVAMRNRIATAVENPNTPARDLASLTKRLTEVVRDIEAIDARGSEGDGDEGPAEDEAFDESAV